MNILVFDTSNDTLTVGLRMTDGRSATKAEAGSRHSEIIFPAIKACFSECRAAASDLDLVVCAKGPGSFTGLRIGLAAAKGMSLALGKPWVGVPTLDAFAWKYRHLPGTIVPLLDARKHRLFAGIYSGGTLRGEYLDVSEEDLLARLLPLGKILFTGPGTKILSPRLPEGFQFEIEETNPGELATSLAELGRQRLEKKGPAPEDEGPIYLREPEIG